jgi:hypothetical protein
LGIEGGPQTADGMRGDGHAALGVTAAKAQSQSDQGVWLTKNRSMARAKDRGDCLHGHTTATPAISSRGTKLE